MKSSFFGRYSNQFKGAKSAKSVYPPSRIAPVFQNVDYVYNMTFTQNLMKI